MASENITIEDHAAADESSPASSSCEERAGTYSCSSDEEAVRVVLSSSSSSSPRRSKTQRDRIDDITTTTNSSINHHPSTNNKEEGEIIEDDDDDDEAYRLRVYGTGDGHNDASNSGLKKSSSSLRRFSRRLSRQWQRRRSSVQEALPETPAGWTILLTTVASAALGYEVSLQKKLTAPPLVYGQCLSQHNNDHESTSICTSPIADIYQRMLQQPDSILQRPIQPSLFVGTRSALSSAAAYMTAGPGVSEQHVQFRERLRMPADGAVVALDWELPAAAVDTTTSTNNLTLEQRKEQVLKGPIPQPVVLILHGINNDAGFGYMRSMMRECTARGWIAVGMNFRGCGGVPMTTPRTYNGAYTGDIRGVVQTLSPRLHGQQQPLFLVGNSLGANLLAKYLGEEGKSGTLPACVAGGVTMGNPMVIDSRNMSPIYSPLIAAGAKQGLFSVYHSMKNMQSSFLFRKCMHDAWTAFSLADYDRALAPIFSRNDPEYPFGYKIGYESGEAYWKDASSYRQTPFVSVPFLQLVAKDDFLVFHPFRGKLAYNVSNPNVMVMETTCGGHLGWQETPPNGWGLGTSWADAAMADFIQAVLESYREKQLHQQKLQGDTRRADIVSGYREDGRPEGAQLRSRL